MSNWRDAILKEFVPNVSKLTLVADPDCLLTEEKLVCELRRRGFDLIEFNDAIELRYVYESKYRSVWDQGDQTDLIVILRLESAELDSLPYDLLQAGRKLSFNLGDLFPNLSYPVVEKLDKNLFDRLFDAQSQWAPDRIGDKATQDFILRHAFSIAPELIVNEIDLLRILLRLHYGNNQIAPNLVERLRQVLANHPLFKTWPLSEIVPDDKAFYAFLQERWPLFLSQFTGANRLREDSLEYNLQSSSADYLPFDHQDIRVYIDNLFMEGKLTPVQVIDLQVEPDSWIQCGITASNRDNENFRIDRLFDLLEKDIPTEESRYSDWINFALKWAELSSLVYCGNSAERQNRLKESGDVVNTAFANWLFNSYASLINLPPTNPVMLHHVPRRLARDLQHSSSNPAALLVVDGLALDQWVTLRKLLQNQDASLVTRETAVFAWIPTLTSVSRQSIFSGKPPLYYPSSINSTNSEEKLWKQFWEGYGLSKLDIAYRRGLGDGDASSELDSIIHPGKTKVVGLVIDKVDKIMHGMELGSAGMHNQIMLWCQGEFLLSLVSELLNYKYDVWLTSDHGNIQCDGKGRPSEGSLAELRGERVRVYPTPELRSQVASSFPSAYQWQPAGLPEGYFPLVAGLSDAFIRPGESIVAHGGIAMQEVIVPFVKFERKTR